MKFLRLWTKTIPNASNGIPATTPSVLSGILIAPALLRCGKNTKTVKRISVQRLYLFLTSCIILFSIFGCVSKRKQVWIDLGKVRNAFSVPKSEFRLPAPEIISPPVQGRTPSLVIQAQRLSGTEARRRKALELMESERVRVIRDLEAVYLHQFMTEVEATKNQLLEQLHKEAANRIEALLEEVSKWIRAEAPEVGEIKLRLALIEGYPKPRPRNPEVLRKSSVERMWAEEADTLRRRLNNLDESFQTKLQARLEKENVFWASEIRKIEDLVQKTRFESQTAAKALAQQRIKETGRLRLPVLLDAAELHRETQPEIRVELQGISKKPRWREAPILQPPIHVILRTKLDIWLAVHGYKLANSPEEGEDRTQEFIAWLHRNKFGH